MGVAAELIQLICLCFETVRGRKLQNTSVVDDQAAWEASVVVLENSFALHASYRREELLGAVCCRCCIAFAWGSLDWSVHDANNQNKGAAIYKIHGDHSQREIRSLYKQS